MRSKYPVLEPKKIIKILKKFGFFEVSQKGSHKKFKSTNNSNKTVIIPMHYEIAKGTLKSILEQSGIPLEEFLKYLD